MLNHTFFDDKVVKSVVSSITYPVSALGLLSGSIGPKIQLELAPQVEKESREENKEATNNVKTDVTSKGLRIKDPCQQVRIY